MRPNNKRAPLLFNGCLCVGDDGDNQNTRTAAMAKRKKGSTISYQYSSGGVEEILRPTLVVCGGRSYRKLTEIEFGRRGGGRGGRDAEKQEETQASDVFVEGEAVYRDDVYDEGEDVDREVAGAEKLSNGYYRLNLPVASVFFKYIIGREGRIKKGIERDTECRLWLPSKGVEGDVGM